MSDKETIEEFLARGGEIQKIEAVKPEHTPEVIKPAGAFNAQTMSLELGEFFFAEKTKRKGLTKEQKDAKRDQKISGTAAAKYLDL